MTFDNQVKTAFIISVLLHSFIIFAWPAISILLPKKPAVNFEVNYYRVKKYKSVSPKTQVPQHIQQAQPKKQTPVKTVQQQREKLLIAAQKRIEQAKKARQQEALVKKEDESIVIPPLPKGVEKIPGYLDYVQSVREQIRKTANLKFSNRGLAGDVMLNFVLLNDGTLSAVKIVDDRSSQNENLREIGRLAIESAAPFGAFPQDLEYKQLSFSVVISFE